MSKLSQFCSKLGMWGEGGTYSSPLFASSKNAQVLPGNFQLNLINFDIFNK